MNDDNDEMENSIDGLGIIIGCDASEASFHEKYQIKVDVSKNQTLKDFSLQRRLSKSPIREIRHKRHLTIFLSLNNNSLRSLLLYMYEV